MKQWILLLVYTLLVCTEATFFSENVTSSHVCRRITADEEIKELILNNQQTARPCACHEQQMALDYSFQKIDNCYKQWFSENGLKQMCCYDIYGSLQQGPSDGGYLIPDILEPDINSIHKACCIDSDLCQTFYELFPSNNCTCDTTVIHAISWGDPEITTVDQHTYSFNGHGEYTFLETPDKSLQVQARTDFLIKGNIDATVFVAFVLADNKKNDTITIVNNRTDTTLNLYQHDGSLWANSKNCSHYPERSFKHGFFLFCSTTNGFGIMLTPKTNIQRITFTGGDFMSVAFDGKRNATGFKGLTGNLEHGYYIYGNGSKVGSNATERDMFYFGESWTVSQNDSKFDNSITGGNFSYWNGNHTKPKFLQDVAEKGDFESLFKDFQHANITQINETCRNSWDNQPNMQCLVTIARTKNVSQGEAIMAAAETNHHMYVLLHNYAPQFKNSTPSFLNVTYGVNSSVNLDLKKYVVDDFDSAESMKYNLVTDIANYTLRNGSFSWLVGTYLRYNHASLAFSVNDTLGFSATRAMLIYYCGCESPSQCDFSSFNANSSENVKKAVCTCPPYSKGMYCERKLDPCNDYHCHDTCNGSFNLSSPAWPCGDCPVGRRNLIVSKNQTCENINECEVGSNPCGKYGHCNDTDGSYKCICDSGFQLNINGHQCDDIDECKDPSMCKKENEICLNSAGNYSCICDPGYDRINGTCKDIVGSMYVGHMCFTFSTTIKDMSEINKTIDTPENRRDIQEKLTARFKDTNGFSSVEVFRLSLVIRRQIGAMQDTGQYDLRCDYVVHLTNVPDIKVIGEKLLDSFTSNNGLNTPLKVGDIDINLGSAVNHINNATTEGGICGVPCKTDCAPDSTNCIDKPNGEFECKCKSGYEPGYLSKTYCIDTNECVAFERNGTIEERCVHGNCYNTIGSWNCSCPPTKQWQNVGNATIPVYRCQGNFSYIGNLSILWRGVASSENIINSVQNKLEAIYRNKTFENATDEVPIRNLFVFATVLSLKEDRSASILPLHKFTVMYNLRMGESVGTDRVSNVLKTAFDNKNLWFQNTSQGQDMTFMNGLYYIFKDSDNILCNLTSNGNCDPVSTICRQQNGTTFCKCKGGYAKLNPSAKFCIDINECDLKESCVDGGCKNLDGSWACLCPDGKEPRTINSTMILCSDINECNSAEYFCANGKCVNTMGNWSCICQIGFEKKVVSKFVVVCEDIDECADTKADCSGHGTCINTLGGYNCSCDDGYYMSDTDRYSVSCNDINECKLAEYSCENGSCNNIMGNWSCICPIGYQKKVVSKHAMVCEGNSTTNTIQLADAIIVSCSGSQWEISIDMDKLQQLYPGILAQDIFFGQTNCRGTLENTILTFKQSLHMCSTTEKTSDRSVIYNNKLFYAILDPINPFLIRQHIWTFAVECDVMRGGLGSSHLHHNIETHTATAVEQYNVSVELFSDRSYVQSVTSSKHNFGVGDEVYVKVSTTLTDWNIKMRLHTCYTKPYNNAPQDKDVLLINDGCEVGSNTHIISQSTHETKFVLQDFEYVSNDEGLYIYCNATFCDSKDYSAECVQYCRQTPAFVG